MEDQSPLSSYTIDPRGDLWLCVGEDLNLVDDSACQFRVCSRTLARSSNFFKVLLFHDWLESQPPQGSSEIWSVKLPEDNPSTTRYLFEAMHGNFKSFGNIDMTVQACSDIARIFELVKLADKYACLATLGPWSASWLAACDAFLHKADTRQYFGAHADHRKNVFPQIGCIAYLLGDRDVFKRVMTELVGIHSIQLSWYSGYPLLVNFEAYIPNLTNTIKEEQDTLYSSILSAAQAMVDSLEAGNPDFGARHPIRHHCSSPTDKTACAAHNLKCLTDALGRAGLWPLPSTSPRQFLTPLALRDKLVSVHTELHTVAGERVRCTAASTVRVSNGSNYSWLGRAVFFLDEPYKYVLTADDEKNLAGQAALVSSNCPFRV